MYIRLFCFCLLIFFTGCASQVPAPVQQQAWQPGQFFSHNGTPVTWESFLDAAADADYILLGENHDNAFHHMMQARVLSALAAKGVQPVLGLEMLSRNLQPKLDLFNRGKIALASVSNALEWQKNWGFDYALYTPVFQAAHQYRIPIYALNIPKGVLDKVRQGGVVGVPAGKRHEMATMITPPPLQQRTMLEGVFAMHKAMAGNKMPSAKIPAADLGWFLLAQSLWDSTMAETAYRVHQKEQRPVVILAGSGHVEYGYGIYSRLQRLDRTAKILLVLPAELPVGIDPAGSSRALQGEDGAITLSSPAHYYFYAPKRAVLRLGLELEFGQDSVTVRSVESGSAAAKAGVWAGDVVVMLNGIPIKSGRDLHVAAQKNRDTQGDYVFTLLRQGQSLRVVVAKPREVPLGKEAPMVRQRP